MKFTVKKVDATKRELDIEVPKETVSQKFDEVYEAIAKNAKIRGFRPGKAPRQIVEQHHKPLAQEEVLKDLIPATYEEVLKKENLKAIALPEIFDVKLEAGILSYKAKLEIKPEVEIRDYKGLKIKKMPSNVTDEDLKKSYELILQSRGGPKETPIDDSFARSLGYTNLKELEASFKKQLEINCDQQAKIDLENQIIEQLLAKAKFEVPEASVNSQLEHLVKDAKMRLSWQGLKKEDIEAKHEGLRKELKDIAHRDVKVYFVLEKIAELENIKVDHEDNLLKKVMEFLLKEARWEQ
ncbi:MAG: trigger factor [Candidatus Omnitrophota bacterium]|nr:trigger factor [Candidatus Omnitrophota bacterium]